MSVPVVNVELVRDARRIHGSSFVKLTLQQCTAKTPMLNLRDKAVREHKVVIMLLTRSLCTSGAFLALVGGGGGSIAITLFCVRPSSAVKRGPPDDREGIGSTSELPAT